MRKPLIATVAAAVGLVTLAPAAVSAHDGPEYHDGPLPTLAEILLSDSDGDVDGFDHNWRDYDIVTEAVLLFPDLVAAASNPDAELTVFLPNDRAFRKLVKDITGERPRSEADTFAAVASLGTDTVKNVLLYHIVPGSISFETATGANGAVLPTLLEGSTIEVKVRGKWHPRVKLIDADTDDRNPKVIAGDLGGPAANGYAHGINRVLRPINLP